MTCPTDNVLAQLVDGLLDDITRVTIERHLDACVACSDLVAELAQLLAPPPPAPVGYRLLRELSPETWEAEAPNGDRVAISFGSCSPSLVAVRDPHVVHVEQVGALDGKGFVIHALTGMTVRAWCDHRPRTPAEILAVWRRALAGLAALHRAGVMHEVSPDHVFVDGDEVRVGAFTAALGKTSGYLAPERLHGAPASQRADQYAACVAIWEALAGDKPFSGATIGALAVSTSMPPAPPDASFRPLVRGLAVDPAARWPDLESLAGALGRRSQTGATLLAIAIAALIVLLALLARG